ncbi:ATP-dependent translocase ABCB1-like isoform X2 [Ruditapes philippinarum]|uniref:ATP-dependent translocase ABCB1-like isoform X2 n=1 Tax=Ruditapes philippinarum TaxID=129788 RepID=UPI00295A8BD8|nr:ATP-dependent translocase ABCB1-like isoform X2 [Ruditapes philippinarum]
MDEADERQPLISKDASLAINKASYTQSGSEKGDTNTAEEKKDDRKTASLRKLFRTADRLDIFLMFMGGLAAVVHGAGWSILILFFGDITDLFITVAALNSTEGRYDEFNTQMTKYSLYYVYIGVAVFVASYIQVCSWTVTCERQVHRIQKQFFRAILRQEIAWFDAHQSGELTTRLACDLDRVREGLADKFSYAIQFTAQFSFCFAIGFWKGWKLSFVIMSLSPLLAIGAAFKSKLIANFSKREQETYAQGGGVAEEVLSCIKTVASFNGQNQDLKRYEEKLEYCKNLGIKKSYITGTGQGFPMLVMFSAYALAFWYGTEQVKSGDMTGGTVITVFFCVLIGTFSIGNITPHLTAIVGAKGAAAVLIDIIDNDPEIDASSRDGEDLQDIHGNIEFKDVDFTYPTRKDVSVLKSFNMNVRSGETVALVGPSGCGKSTAVNLVQRFYDPDKGSVSIDGRDIRGLNLKSLRNKIGVVSQEPILFGISIKENILLGQPNARYEEVERAAKESNCHDFIMALPQGYDTLVGERGAQLSGGQKQRVAIARALIRDPRILLLDEATSALDTQSERVVQDALDKARQGRTTIVIAHRLSTIQNADVINVVQDGVIVESGKHSDLMQKHGVYHQLVTVQMLIEEDEDMNEDDNAYGVDLVLNGIPRKMTISENKQLKKSTSRQISKLISKPSATDDEKDIEEEVETAPGAKFCPMLQENKPELPFILIGCMAAAVNGCTMPAFAIFFSEIIKVFMNNYSDSFLWSMMFLALGGVQFIVNFLQSVCFGHSGERLTFRLRLKTFRAFMRQDMSYFDDPKHSTGALTTRLATDASQVKNATGIRIATMIQSLFGLVAALVIAFIYGWKLAFVVLAGVPLMALAGALQYRFVMGNHKKDNVDLEAAGETASEAIENIRTVQSLTREPDFFQKYATSLNKPYRTNIKAAQLTGLTLGFSQGIVFMIYAGAFRFGAYMVTTGDMTPDNVFKVFFAISMTGIVIGQSSSFLPDYSKAATAGGLIFKTLDTIPLIDVFSKRGQYLSNISGRVQIRNVTFNYPMRPDVPVLKGINIDVEPGQTVALVGPSGCGKSTVVSLLQRFYDPQDGSISIDGINIKDINLIRLRHLISVVSQEPVLFDCSIKDNITYGLDSSIGMDEVIASARAANIHDFISNLPSGYDTVVGEKGTQLSGGQKQRVAIARALVRNPKILLLDEATSALDTESEQVVQAALDNAQEGRTCIVIAHRLSTIQNADVIYVIDAGKVVESGNHQHLLNKKGVYATLVSGQQLSK